MEFFNGQDRILFLKLNGNWTPVGCLTDNSMEESSEMMDTTTRDNQGWTTSRPIMQSYSLSFNGLQMNTTVAGGNFNAASYDRLKQLKRDKILLDWKIEGTVYPIVDYGKGYITNLGEANVIDELMTFNGGIAGFGKPLMAPKGSVVLNTGDENEWLNSGNTNEVIKTTEI